MPSAKEIGRQAGHFAKFAKHVIPAAVKPMHSLWHEVLGFFFLAFAGIGLWKIYRNAAVMGPIQVTILTIFIVVMIIYGVSSFLKARRISRS
jgi:uncharacterized membrane protein